MTKNNYNIKELKQEYAELEHRFLIIKNEIDIIHGSVTWKLLVRIKKFISIFLPEGGRQRVFVRRFIVGIYKFIRGMDKNILGFFIRLHKRIRPPKKRIINAQSKKILYVGHSYHAKTQSTEFLKNYLKQYFKIEEVLDLSWCGAPFPDLSFVDDSYFAVIFFQNLPSIQIFNKIKNDNLIFFPMYDSRLGQDYMYLRKYKNIKTINFSKHTYDSCVKFGVDSLYIKYFPEVPKYNPGKIDKVFFWQRLTDINVNTITKLVGESHVKIHIHKAVDPGHQFIKPTRRMEKQYSITYSSWFKTRKEMIKLMLDKAIYVAPREYEGIGLGFLEAMAAGKAVVAVNNPTMNEYIKNNENGYLFNLSNLKPLDFSQLRLIQKKCYEYMKEGRNQWEKNKQKIIDFMRQP